MLGRFLKGVWAFCSYVFVPQWGRHQKDSGSREARKNKDKVDPYVKKEDASVVFYQSLLEGCYHEMGHVLAALLFFPKEERIESVSFAKKPNGGFGFNTNYHVIQWSLPSQKEALIMCSIGGGIFQQMKMIYNDIKGHSDFCQWSVSALRDHLYKNIKCPNDGMEVDLAYLDNLYSELQQYRTDTEPLNLEEEKKKAIDLFMPYLENKKIDEFCVHFANEIMANRGVCDTIIKMKDIKARIGVRC